MWCDEMIASRFAPILPPPPPLPPPPSLLRRFLFARAEHQGGGEEDPEQVKKELARERGAVRVDNDQNVYEVDTAALEAQVCRRDGCISACPKYLVLPYK